MRYAESEMRRTDRRQGRLASSASTARSSPSHGTSEPRAMKIDASERRLLKAFEAGEWTGVGRLATARARYGRIAKATLRRLRRV